MRVCKSHQQVLLRQQRNKIQVQPQQLWYEEEGDGIGGGGEKKKGRENESSALCSERSRTVKGEKMEKREKTAKGEREGGRELPGNDQIPFLRIPVRQGKKRHGTARYSAARNKTMR